MSRQSSLSVRTGRKQTSRKLLTVAQVAERLNVSELNVLGDGQTEVRETLARFERQSHWFWSPSR
jgi:hypothetical protein